MYVVQAIYFTLFLQGFCLEPQWQLLLHCKSADLHGHLPLCWQVDLHLQNIASVSYHIILQ